MRDHDISHRRANRLVRIYGKPVYTASHDGAKITSRAILKWAGDNDVEWHYIDPGEPQQNGVIESRSTAACVMSYYTKRCSTTLDDAHREVGPLAIRQQQRQTALIARKPNTRRSASSA